MIPLVKELCEISVVISLVMDCSFHVKRFTNGVSYSGGFVNILQIEQILGFV